PLFATAGEGEAIAAGYHYWGTDVLKRLRGMFAFALWDTVTRELFCARDPFGIKPLFMATGTGGTAVCAASKRVATRGPGPDSSRRSRATSCRGLPPYRSPATPNRPATTR